MTLPRTFQGGPSRIIMRLVWDWRLARILTEEGDIVDESIWNGSRNEVSVAERLSVLARQGMTEEARILNERFPDAVPSPVQELPAGWWPELSMEEMDILRQATLVMAKRDIAAVAGDPDQRLDHLVRGGDELRASFTTLEARVVEWAGMFLPEVDLDGQRDEIPAAIAQSSSLQEAAERLGGAAAPSGISDAEWMALRRWAVGVVAVESRLKAVETATREVAKEHLPSLSKLLGPLLAARMCTAAHGRQRLARLPSGTVQVLGAESSFFRHLRDGIPVPKHGHLFQHPWVSRSPRWVRGKIARMLSGKVSLAARLDAWDGEPLSDEAVAEVEGKVAEIRARHAKPSKR